MSEKSKNDTKIERRVLREIELREADDGDDQKIPTITGYAAVFDLLSEDLGGFREQIDPGAFKAVLKTNPDVRALVNHDPNQRIGRSIAGTLTMREDRKGLRVEITPPDTQVGRDTVEDIRNGNLDGMSFSFTTRTDQWERSEDNAPDIRTLIEIEKLYDVGPVTFPAYPDTSVATRSLEEFRKAQETQEAQEAQTSPNQINILSKKLDLAEAE